MDLTDLAQQHGPLGIIAAVVLLFVRQLFANGIKLTVTHDPEQMKTLAEAIGAAGAAASSGRLDDVESDVVELRESLATVKTKLDERTKRAGSSAPTSAAKT